MIWAEYPVVQISIFILFGICFLSCILDAYCRSLQSSWWKPAFLALVVLIGGFNAVRYISGESVGLFWWDTILGVVGLCASIYLYRRSIHGLFTDTSKESQLRDPRLLEMHIYAVIGYLICWGFIAESEFLSDNSILANATVSRMLPRMIATNVLWLIVAFVSMNIILGVIELKRCGLCRLKSVAILLVAIVMSGLGLFVYGPFLLPIALVIMTLAIILFCLRIMGSFLSNLR